MSMSEMGRICEEQMRKEEEVKQASELDASRHTLELLHHLVASLSPELSHS